MDKEKVAKRAKEFVDILADEGFTLAEARLTLQMARESCDEASRNLARMKSKTALKDILKAAEDYPSNEGKSPSEYTSSSASSLGKQEK